MKGYSCWSGKPDECPKTLGGEQRAKTPSQNAYSPDLEERKRKEKIGSPQTYHVKWALNGQLLKTPYHPRQRGSYILGRKKKSSSRDRGPYAYR